MNVLFVVLSLVMVVLNVVLIAIILMQKKNIQGFGGSALGSTGGAQTYWDKNKGRSLEGQLEKYTKILGAAFLILAFIINFVK